MDLTRTAPDAPPAPGGPAAGGTALRRLLDQVTAALRDATPVHGYQRVVHAAGVLLLAWGVVHVGVLAVDGGGWDGPLSWRKPILFGVSFGLANLAAGWVLGVLPHHRRWGRTAAALIVVGGFGEVGLISMQTWRGTASHFNVFADRFDMLVFAGMAVAIGVYTVGLVVLTAWAALRLRGPRATVVAVLVGLGLFLAGSAQGGDLIERGLAYADQYEAVPAAVVIGVAGSGKVAHAVALHALQVLGVLALLLGRSGLPERSRVRTMVVAAVAYVTLTGSVAAQAYAGRSMLEPTWLLAVAALAAATVVASLAWSVKDAVLGAGREARVG